MQDTLNTLMLMCGRIEEKVDGVKESVADVRKVQKEDGERITKLEHKSTWLTGVAAGVSAVISFLTGSIMKGN